MAYTTNPHLPRLRMQAVDLVRSGWSIRKAARHLGFSHCTIRQWLLRKPAYGWHGQLIIPTRSSKPKSHPRALTREIISRILTLRQERNQCAEILQHRLAQEGITVSLSSVKRVLQRYRIRKYSPWKKWHHYPPRPLPLKPGMLVEIDTIHDGPYQNRLYVYTLLDVYSRFAYAGVYEHISTHRSLAFVSEARGILPFALETLQSDHGPEFSKHFTKMLTAQAITHRHSRIRKPNDNAHLERFNRTLQEECLNHVPRTLTAYHKEISTYLHYYNTKRPHMGIHMKTPEQMVTSY